MPSIVTRGVAIAFRYASGEYERWSSSTPGAADQPGYGFADAAAVAHLGERFFDDVLARLHVRFGVRGHDEAVGEAGHRHRADVVGHHERPSVDERPRLAGVDEAERRARAAAERDP